MPTLLERKRDFLAALEDIALRNAEYFLFKETGTGSQDRLSNHWKFELQEDKALFGFIEGSDVPVIWVCKINCVKVNYFKSNTILSGNQIANFWAVSAQLDKGIVHFWLMLLWAR